MTQQLTYYPLGRFLNDEKTNDTQTGQDLGSRELLRATPEGEQ